MSYTPLSPLARKTLVILVDQITHLPQGYLFWHSLPSKGRKSPQVVLRRWTKLLVSHLYPATLRKLLLTTCVDADGVPDQRGRPLYLWCLRHLYNNNARLLHKDWSYLKQAASQRAKHDKV